MHAARLCSSSIASSSSLGSALRFVTLFVLTAVQAAAPAAAAKKSAGRHPPAATTTIATLASCGRDVALRAERGDREGRKAAGAASPSGEWRDCEVGATLTPLDRTRTGKTGLATLVLRLGTVTPPAPTGAATPGGTPPAAGGDGGPLARVALDPASQLQLLAPNKKSPLAIALSEGAARIAWEAQKPEGTAKAPVPPPLRVQLPDAELRLRGVARVELGPGPGDATVAVYEGQAELSETRGRRSTVKLPAGTGALLRRGAKLRSGGLIGAPAWEGARRLFFALPQRGPVPAVADVALPFRAVAAAQRYRLEVGRDEALSDRVLSSVLAGDQKRATLRLPGRGRYFARLSAVDSDQVAGPGVVQPIEVVEVRGERIGVAAPEGGATVLTGTGELAFDLLSGGGRLQVQLDDKPVPGDSQSPAYVQVRADRGAHRVLVQDERGHRGELRVQVSRPSYEIELSQGLVAAAGRGYRIEVRALDGAGQKPTPVVGLAARTVAAPEQGGERAINLVAKAPGIYQGELSVPSGQVLRLAIADRDGPLASAELRGSPE